ncbi:hypothetical protein KNHN1_39700 [Pseudomonas guariconensis]
MPELARLLSTTLEELFGQQQETTVPKRGPAPKWQQQPEAINQLPKSQQKLVAQILGALLAQATMLEDSRCLLCTYELPINAIIWGINFPNYPSMQTIVLCLWIPSKRY